MPVISTRVGWIIFQVTQFIKPMGRADSQVVER